MTYRRTLVLAVLMLVVMAPAFAADASGIWKASFDTQIGVQNYTYDFKVEGGKLTGKATSDNGQSDIQEGKVSGDDISFVENLSFQGQSIRVEYKGKISGDEIKFIRTVGDFATEQLVAKRAK